MSKYKERGHSRAERLDLKKPHIMYCRHLKQWLLAVYTWETEMPAEYIAKALDLCDKLNLEQG